MTTGKQPRFSLESLILLTAPLWMMVFAAFLGMFIQAFSYPLSKLGESRLVFFFVLLPALISFIVGNVHLFNMQKTSKPSRLVLAVPYSLAALFVEFFAGWWALMTMGL